MKCQYCGHQPKESSALFCSQCGSNFFGQMPGPYVGEDIDRGIYRVHFQLEDEFDNESSAYSAITSHKYWAERAIKGKPEEFRAELIQSTVTKKTHPYVCGNCYRHVSKQKKGRCKLCSHEEWKKRSDKTKSLERNPPPYRSDYEEDPFLC